MGTATGRETDTTGAAATGPVLFIVARAQNGCIGRDGGLPWRIPADLAHFKRLTMGPDGKGWPMIMGRKTFDSLPGILPDRPHIVLTRDAEWQAEGAQVVHTCEAAMQLARELAGADGTIAIIGGAEIFALFADTATHFELTEVLDDVAGDTFMPAPGPDWREVSREHHAATSSAPAYDFVSYVRAADAAGTAA